MSERGARGVRKLSEKLRNRAYMNKKFWQIFKKSAFYMIISVSNLLV